MLTVAYAGVAAGGGCEKSAKKYLLLSGAHVGVIFWLPGAVRRLMIRSLIHLRQGTTNLQFLGRSNRSWSTLDPIVTAPHLPLQTRVGSWFQVCGYDDDDDD